MKNGFGVCSRCVLTGTCRSSSYCCSCLQVKSDTKTILSYTDEQDKSGSPSPSQVLAEGIKELFWLFPLGAFLCVFYASSGPDLVLRKPEKGAAVGHVWDSGCLSVSSPLFRSV